MGLKSPIVPMLSQCNLDFNEITDYTYIYQFFQGQKSINLHLFSMILNLFVYAAKLEHLRKNVDLLSECKQ